MLSHSVMDWYLPTLEGVSLREGLGQDQPSEVIVSSEVHMECLTPIVIKHHKAFSTWVWTRPIMEQITFIVSEGNMLHMHLCFQWSAYGQT